MYLLRYCFPCPLFAIANPENQRFHVVSNCCFSDIMVVSQPSLVYDMGSNKFRIKDKTAANQTWWLFQPRYRFTVLANSILKINVSYSTSGIAELEVGSENGSLKNARRRNRLLIPRLIILNLRKKFTTIKFNPISHDIIGSPC